jgi:tetratricopeptide (TPR) repeat protein
MNEASESPVNPEWRLRRPAPARWAWPVLATLSFGCDGSRVKQQRFAVAAFNRGFDLSRDRKKEEAIVAFREAIRLKPDYVDAHSALGSELLMQGKLEEAIVEIREAIRLKPGRPGTTAGLYSILCDALVSQGKPEEAIAPYREAIRLMPDGKYAHCGLGSVLYRQGKLKEAIAALRAAIKIDPNYHNAHYYLGSALAKLGKDQEAIAEFQEAIRIKPEGTIAHTNMAFVIALDPARSRQEFEQALVHAQKGIEASPNEGGASMAMSLVEYRLGHLTESLAAAQRGMSLSDGGNAFYWFVLAMVHSRNGEKDKARQWFDKAVVQIKQDAPDESDARRLWTEAAKLLDQPGPPAASKRAW